MKKFLAVLLTLMLVLTALPFAAIPAGAETTYTVTLHQNYEGATPTSDSTVSGEMTLPGWARSGYTFVGWTYEGDIEWSARVGYPKYHAGDTISPLQVGSGRPHITFYAQWSGPESPFVGDNDPVDGGYVWVNGVCWRVIGRGEQSELLISAEVLGGNQTFAEANAYCDDVYAAFSPLEKAAVLPTTQGDVEYKLNNTYTLLASDLDNANLFLLSASEAAAYFHTPADKELALWWLRSLRDDGAGAAIKSGGTLNTSNASSSLFGARPAFQLDTNKVLFISAAEGGKAGDGALALIGDESGLDKKLTLLDEGRAFAVTGSPSIAAPGDTITLNYTGAETGENEYISAFLTTPTGEQLYYGRLAASAAETGTVSFTVPAGLADGYYLLQCFNEQYNGDYQTDIASAFSTVGLTVGEDLNYGVGDTVVFGSYPQSLVTDPDTHAALEAADKVWTSYRYYSGTGQRDGQMQPGNWMRFADLYLNGEKYRAVIFDAYRPSITWGRNGIGAFQSANGYEPETVYYFKYEPLQWRVLDPFTGLIVSEYAIDAQPYQNMVYATNTGKCYQTSSCETYSTDYPTSTIRAWLNEDFYNVAFTGSQKDNIRTTTITTSAETNDKVFLLSKDEATNVAYGLGEDEDRITTGTDYAKSQNNEVKDGKSEWPLRHTGGAGGVVGFVRGTGAVEVACSTGWASAGVRPAIVLSELAADNAIETTLYSHVKEGHTVREAVPENEIFTGCMDPGSYESVVYCSCGAELSRVTVTVPAIGSHTWDEGEITKPATCVAMGETTYHCTVEGCNGEKTETDVQIDTANHADYGTEVVNATAAACYRDGYTGDTVCARCRALLTPGETISKDTVPHAWDEGTVTLKPTCSTTGTMLYRCTVKSCGATKEEEIKKDPDAHVFRTDVIPPTCTDDGYTSYACTLCRYGYAADEQPALGHRWSAPVWSWSGTSSASATFTCANGDHPVTVAATLTSETVKAPTDTEAGKTVYTATAEFEGETYTNTVEKSIPALNEGLCKWCGERHDGSFWQRIVGFFHSIAYFFAHLFGRR